ncbi:hypothetical protein [Roseixanthobacter glucoisosaccharinicivorans]|uniref:hypothetical protein n=1 Tax=Roseixanthobacter glucoisosaccharinicivorans TaxID=3119923 RepID=UPI00372ACB23
MTTLREVKRLVSPLLEKNKDLALIGRVIVIKSVKHVLKGIFFNRTSMANCFEMWLSIMFLCGKYDHFTFKIENPIYPSRSGLWLLSDSGISKTVCDRIEEVALPKLQALGSDLDYIRSRREKNPSILQRTGAGYFLYRIAEGSLDEARDLITTSPFAARMWLPSLKNLGLDEKLLAHGNKLPHADRLILANFLHEREAYSVEKLKLGKIWERTPFPLETAPLL